jgi:TonB family protein
MRDVTHHHRVCFKSLNANEEVMKMRLDPKSIFTAMLMNLCILPAVQAQNAQEQAPEPEVPKIVRKAGGVLQGSAIKRVEPNYPTLAIEAGADGPVVVQVTVDEGGSVISARAISGHPLLKDAAVAAARGWKFVQTELSGVPVKVIGTITFRFEMGSKGLSQKEIEHHKEEVSAQDSDIESDLVTATLGIFGNQPDYTADVSIVIASPIRMKMARKEGKVRLEWLNPSNAASGENKPLEYYRTIVINRPDQPSVAFDPQQKTYCEMPNESKPPAPEMLHVLKEAMKGKEEFKIKLKNLGTEILDGHETVKMEMISKRDKPSQSDKGGLFFYIAKDLKNLVIKMEVTELYEDQPTPVGQGWSYTLSNISLEVPDDLFQMPVGYKKVDFRSFMATFKQNTSK